MIAIIDYQMGNLRSVQKAFERVGHAAAVTSGGEIVARYHKIFLPNYGVFDEARYFEPGDECPVFEVHGVNLGVNVCEDIWYEEGPSTVQRAAGAMERLIELLDTAPTITSPNNPVALQCSGGRIDIEGLSFHYPARPDVAALADFDLRVRPGESLAVSGISRSTTNPQSLYLDRTNSSATRQSELRAGRLFYAPETLGCI